MKIEGQTVEDPANLLGLANTKESCMTVPVTTKDENGCEQE
jgi:hypothetical protein